MLAWHFKLQMRKDLEIYTNSWQILSSVSIKTLRRWWKTRQTGALLSVPWPKTAEASMGAAVFHHYAHTPSVLGCRDVVNPEQSISQLTRKQLFPASILLQGKIFNITTTTNCCFKPGSPACPRKHTDHYSPQAWKTPGRWCQMCTGLTCPLRFSGRVKLLGLF